MVFFSASVSASTALDSMDDARRWAERGEYMVRGVLQGRRKKQKARRAGHVSGDSLQ